MHDGIYAAMVKSSVAIEVPNEVMVLLMARSQTARQKCTEKKQRPTFKASVNSFVIEGGKIHLRRMIEASAVRNFLLWKTSMLCCDQLFKTTTSLFLDSPMEKESQFVV
jgi:hypothetical protein